MRGAKAPETPQQFYVRCQAATVEEERAVAECIESVDALQKFREARKRHDRAVRDGALVGGGGGGGGGG
jgi:hypothetical protein